uniref:Secreted protein n=1 Tax=Solanum lycopersicum TaxID=4081 RepID=A0A3Q7IGL4_SOLLC
MCNTLFIFSIILPIFALGRRRRSDLQWRCYIFVEGEQIDGKLESKVNYKTFLLIIERKKKTKGKHIETRQHYHKQKMQSVY